MSRVAVLWDLDGTLCDLVIDIEDVRSWKRTLGERFAAKSPPYEGSWSPFLPSLEAALETTAASLVERVAAYADLDRWEGAAVQRIDVHDDALSRVALLSESYVWQGIITNNGRTAADAGLAALAQRSVALGFVLPRWDAVVTRVADVRAKPLPDMLHRALPAEPVDGVVVVGDQPGDAAAARALHASGVPTVYVRAAAGALSAPDDVAATLLEWGLDWLLTAEWVPA